MFLILVSGAPACGKSSFAAFLGKELGIPVAAKDDIKEILFDFIGFKTRDEKHNLDRCSTEMMYLFAEYNLSAGKSIILDNNFESSSRPSLVSLTEKYGITPITVLFKGDMKVIYNRFLERDLSPERHRGHIVNKSYPEITKEEYIPIGEAVFEQKYTERGMVDFHMGNTITVDCTDFSKIDYNSILNEVKKLIS